MALALQRPARMGLCLLLALTALGQSACSKSSRGAQLARQHCSSCHLFPAPDVLPRAAWPHVLDYMGLFLGAPARANAHSDIGKLRVDLQKEGLLRSQPLVGPADYALIREFYESEAPKELSDRSQADLPNTNLFRARRTGFYRERPSITLLRVIPNRPAVLVADALTRTLATLDAQGAVVAEQKLAGPPSSVVFGADGAMHLALLYLAEPKPSTEAGILSLSGGRSVVHRSPLPRLAHLSAGDFWFSGSSDLIASGFGLFRGGLYFVPTTSRGRRRAWSPELLYDGPGWIQTAALDWNSDGTPDLLVLRAQAREGLFWIDGRELRTFLNSPADRAGKNPTPVPTLRPLQIRHPAFGFVSFATASTTEGKRIVALVNGDNGDLPDVPLRSYHGIRIYEQRDRLHELRFLPLPGAYSCVLADFDGDGDLDVAAIAFYPNWQRKRPLGFVYYENTGDWNFRPALVAETEFGRWITMSAGDIDNDGDTDLVLGSYFNASVPTPPAYQKILERRGHTVLILENTSKRK